LINVNSNVMESQCAET